MIAILALFLTQNQVSQPKKPALAAPTITFEKQLRPLLNSQCVGCHNRTTVGNLPISGGLALDDFAGLMRGVVNEGKARAVVAIGKPDGSELFTRLLSTEPSRRMPKGGEPLGADKINLIKNWILAGAPRGKVVANTTANTTEIKIPKRMLWIDFAIPVNPPKDSIPPGAKDPKLMLGLSVGPLAPVTALAFSPDGKLLAVGSYRSVTLWDLKTGIPTRTLMEPEGAVQSLCWTRDGKRLAVAGGVAGATGAVEIYETDSWKSTVRLTGHTDVVYSVDFSSDGTKLATGSQDKTIRTWDASSGKPLLTLKVHSDVVYRVRFSTDGKTLFSCGQDKSVRQMQVSDGAVVRSFEGHQQPVTALAVKPDSPNIITSGVESRVRWWNIADGGTPKYSDGAGKQVNDLVFSTDGKWLGATGADRVARVWDSNGGQIAAFEPMPDWGYAIAISPDKKLVAAGCANGLVYIHDAKSSKARVIFASARPLGPKVTESEWFALGQCGAFAVSPGWKTLLRTTIAGIVPARSAEFLKILSNAELIPKELELQSIIPIVIMDAPVKTPALPTPAVPTKPAGGKL